MSHLCHFCYRCYRFNRIWQLLLVMMTLSVNNMALIWLAIEFIYM